MLEREGQEFGHEKPAGRWGDLHWTYSHESKTFFQASTTPSREHHGTEINTVIKWFAAFCSMAARYHRSTPIPTTLRDFGRTPIFQRYPRRFTGSVSSLRLRSHYRFWNRLQSLASAVYGSNRERRIKRFWRLQTDLDFHESTQVPACWSSWVIMRTERGNDRPFFQSPETQCHFGAPASRFGIDVANPRVWDSIDRYSWSVAANPARHS